MPKKYTDKAVSQIRIDAVLFEKLKKIAERENRSMNSQIEFFLKLGVARYEAAVGQAQRSDE